MIEIQIAGAGAGKTFGLAESVIDCVTDSLDHKTTYALTYTNEATKKITTEVVKQIGHIPDKLVIQTVHTFLLNEVIYPFSPYVLGEIYNTSSKCNLPQNRYKAAAVKRLKERNIMHVEEVYAASRRVLDQSMALHNTIAKRAKVDKALSLIASSAQKIFIDEAQDLDQTAVNCFESLGLSGIPVYMIGDPKQAIKYPSALNDLIDKYQTAPSPLVSILPFNNQTRRVPAVILDVSNEFCYPDQRQISISDEPGSITILESIETNFTETLSAYIQSENIVCIDKKTGNYSTRSTNKLSVFEPDIADIIKAASGDRDPEISVLAAEIEFTRTVNNQNAATAASNFFENYGIEYDNVIYAKLMSSAVSNNEPGFVVSSIDSIKGLESEVCVFIVTPNMYKYLFKQELNDDQEFNKEWKKVYVALTRCSKDLVFVFDHNLFTHSEYNIDEVRHNFMNLVNIEEDDHVAGLTYEECGYYGRFLDTWRTNGLSDDQIRNHLREKGLDI